MVKKGKNYEVYKMGQKAMFNQFSQLTFEDGYDSLAFINAYKDVLFLKLENGDYSRDYLQGKINVCIEIHSNLLCDARSKLKNFNLTDMEKY
jgi:hypothetical protein